MQEAESDMWLCSVRSFLMLKYRIPAQGMVPVTVGKPSGLDKPSQDNSLLAHLEASPR